MKTWIYWKPEKPISTWHPILDTEQDRRIAINRGAMFFTWSSLSEPVNGNGGPEPVRFGDFPLDFDSTDIGEALKDLRELCLVHLPDLYDVDSYEIQFFLSGSKGFHAILPAKWFNSQDGDPQLPDIYKKIAAQWKEQFGLNTLDKSLYNMKKGKMFRIPNIKRQNGNFKVPLTLEEVRDLAPEELMELGKSPREIELIGDN